MNESSPFEFNKTSIILTSTEIVPQAGFPKYLTIEVGGKPYRFFVQGVVFGDVKTFDVSIGLDRSYMQEKWWKIAQVRDGDGTDEEKKERIEKLLDLPQYRREREEDKH